jgi:hypothetical protein
MTETPMPPVHCPSCNTLLNAATSVWSDEAPSDGAITICIQCGHIMVFEDNRPRNPTSEEMRLIAGNREILKIQKTRATVLHKKGKTSVKTLR